MRSFNWQHCKTVGFINIFIIFSIGNEHGDNGTVFISATNSHEKSCMNYLAQWPLQFEGWGSQKVRYLMNWFSFVIFPPLKFNFFDGLENMV